MPTAVSIALVAAQLTPGTTEIVVAVIGAAGITAAALGTGVAAHLNGRAKKVETTLGEREVPEDPSVVEWLRTIESNQRTVESLTRGHQDWMGRQERKLDGIAATVSELGEKVDASTDQMGRVERRLEDLETRHEHTQGRLEEAIGRIERLEGER